MTYEIKPFEVEHLDQIMVDRDAKTLIDFVGKKRLSGDFKERGPGYTVFYDGSPFMIAGISILWPRVGEGWAMLGLDYKRHGRFIHRVTIKYIKMLVKEYALERLQAVVLKDHWAGIEWVNRLGFEFEGEMPNYFRGATCLRYAKIYEVT